MDLLLSRSSRYIIKQDTHQLDINFFLSYTLLLGDEKTDNLYRLIKDSIPVRYVLPACRRYPIVLHVSYIGGVSKHPMGVSIPLDILTLSQNKYPTLLRHPTPLVTHLHPPPPQPPGYLVPEIPTSWKGNGTRDSHPPHLIGRRL